MKNGIQRDTVENVASYACIGVFVGMCVLAGWMELKNETMTDNAFFMMLVGFVISEIKNLSVTRADIQNGQGDSFEPVERR